MNHDITRDARLRDALALHQQGQLERAAAAYVGLLRSRPGDPDALHMLGVVALQSGQPADALQLIRRSLEFSPSQAMAHANAASALLHLGRPTEALPYLDRAIALQPSLTMAHYNRGAALRDLGRLEHAIVAFDQALRLDPGHADAHLQRADACLALKRAGEALSGYEAALRSTPDSAEVLSNRAAALLELGRPEEARESCERALERKPRHASALVNLGHALRRLERNEEALAAYDAAVASNGSHALAGLARADLLLDLGRAREAFDAADRLIGSDPHIREALNVRGSALLELGDPATALGDFEQALAMKPDCPATLHNCSQALGALGRHEDAVACLSEMLRIDPSLKFAAGERLLMRLQVCDWTDHAQESDRLRELVRGGARGSERFDFVAPFAFLSTDGPPAEQLQCARAYLAHSLRPKSPLWRGERHAHARIRVAYLSADFRDHPVSQLLAGVFESHDRSRFETFAVAFGPAAEDAMRRRLRGAFDHFVELGERDDREAALLLQELQVDIAVDLMGYTRHCRPGILAHRPAPLQVSYLGYPGTMGAEFIDYIVADRHVIPPEEAQHYAEQVVHLPVTLQPNDARREIAVHPGSRAAAGLPDEGFVFCCMNNAYKISPGMFEAWMRLLAAVPGSVLWLAVNGVAADNLRREAQARGVASSRLVFAGRVGSHAQYLARYRLADLFLDTLPYNAHTTASDALWAGLPVLTCTGATYAGRVATSVLHAIGLQELVTADLAQYEATALEIATQPARLAALRARLERHRTTHPLFDTARCTRDLEAAYAGMWQRHRQGLPPAHSWLWGPAEASPARHSGAPSSRR